MMSTAFDTLEISKRLRSVGFDDAQAEAITGVLRESREADLSRLATKDDVARLESTTKNDIARLESTTKNDIARLESTTKNEIARLESTTKNEIARIETTLRAEMEILRRDLTIRLGGMIVVATGILLAAKFFG